MFKVTKYKESTIIDEDIEDNNLDENIENNNFHNTSLNTMNPSILITFLDSLTKMESHYCRASSSKLYLEPVWNTKRALYNFYCNDFCQNHNATPIIQYNNINNIWFDIRGKNISLFKPKKDECDICITFETGNLSIEEKLLHDKIKIEARCEKETDKESIHEVYTVDLQSVLLCPKSNVSSQYYKTKLIVHNFTVYDLRIKLGYCFLWNKTERGLTANKFSLIIIYFLQKFVINMAKEKESVSFYTVTDVFTKIGILLYRMTNLIYHW